MIINNGSVAILVGKNCFFINSNNHSKCDNARMHE